MIRCRNFFTAALCVLLFMLAGHAQSQTIAISVTTTDQAIVTTQPATFVTVRENDASPTVEYLITLPGSNTPIDYAAGTQFQFVSAPGAPWPTGTTIGYIRGASTTGDFVAVQGAGQIPPSGQTKAPGGGSSGGGFTGTVSSPFLPFASGPDALSDTAWEYGQDAGKDLDCYMDNNCQIEITGSGGNADFFSPGGFNINDTGGQNGLSYFGSAFSTLTIGNNGGRGALLALKGATMGSVGLAPGDSDSSLAMTQGGTNTFNFLTDPAFMGICQYGGNENCLTEKFTVMGSGAAFEIGESGETFVDCQSDSCPVGESFQTTYGDEGFNTKMAGGMESMSILSGGDGTTATINLGENGVDGALIVGGSGGVVEIGNQASMSGQRFVCIGTDGKLVSSATACVGT